MVNESEVYELLYRSILKDHVTRTYNDAMAINVEKKISFDAKAQTYSSIDHFAAAIITEMLLALDSHAQRNKEVLLDVEGLIKLHLTNPLTLLNVHGFDEISTIDSIDIKLYLYTFLEDEAAQLFVAEALAKAVLYQTLKDKLKIRLVIEFAL